MTPSTTTSLPDLYRVREESAEVIGPDGSMICENAYQAEQWCERLNRAVWHGQRRAKLPQMMDGYRRILKYLSGLSSTPAATTQVVRDKCAEMLGEGGAA